MASWQDEKATSNNVEEISSHPSSGPRSRSMSGGKLKRHLKRWWWAHLLIFIAITLLLVLLLIYVAFPKISQDDINKSTLTVNALTLSAPAAMSFHLFQNSTIKNSTPYHPRLDAFNASLSLEGGKPYAQIMIPNMHATAEAISIVDQEVTITDLDAFITYNDAVLNQEEVNVVVNGRTALHEMKFPVKDVNYVKTTTMKGLNKLNGFNVTSFEIKLIPEADGTNMVGTVHIPNPSPMTLSMGNVSFINYLPATAKTPRTPIGTSFIDNLVLSPGDNTLSMRSVVNQTLVIGAIATTYKDGMLPVAIVGNSSIYDGQHLTYFEKPLQNLTQHVTLDVGSALKRLGIGPTALATLGGVSNGSSSKTGNATSA